MTKVSFICVYNNSKILNETLIKSLETQTEDYELILIDNRNFKFKNAASALNYGAKKATGTYLYFIHQDINLANPNWIGESIKQIEKLDNVGIIGVAGKTNDKFIRTNIKHGIPPIDVTPFKLNKAEPATTVDECLFIIPKKVFDILQFDAKTCFDWHLYATDYLLSIKKIGYNAYIIPIYLEHLSKGASMSEGYYETIKRLQKKHFNEKIIHNCMTDWYTYIPVSIQRKMKEYNKKNDNIKLNFFDTYMEYKEADKNYHEIDKETYNLIKNSEYFDEDYYRKKYKRVFLKKVDPINHFATVGYKKNYNPSSKFDTSDYYARYHDVKHVDFNPLIHYLKYGKNEGRKVNPVKKKIDWAALKHKTLNLTTSVNQYLFIKSKFDLNKYNQFKKEFDLIKNSKIFDEEFYLQNYPEVQEFNNDPILHYMFIGYKNNFEPNDYFNSEYYKNKYGIDKNPLLMYLENEDEMPIVFRNINKIDITTIEESGLFNKKYYMENYPKTRKYKENLISHYLKIGYKNDYNPSPYFNTKWYLDTYENVKNAKMNPLLHYIKYGQYEKKITKAISEEEAQEIIDKINFNAKKEPLKNFDEESPLVSIIILTRDGVDYLKTLFKNFKETVCYPNYEIIVVDNDSSDNTIEYLKELSKTLPLTIIENKTNETFSEANNKGVKQSKGDYILLLNNDMEPVYGWLNQMMSSYLKSEDIGIVGAKLIYPYREDNPTSLTTQNEGIKYTELNGFLNKNDGYIVPYNIKENSVFDKDSEDEEIASILGAALLIKKDLYQELGGLDDKYFYNYEDIDLCFKVIEKGYKVIYAPKAKLYHYYQATRENTFDLSPNDMKNRTHLYYKWNKWLSEKLFIDRLENKLIFSEKPLNIFYLSKNHELLETDKLINKTDSQNYKYTENFTKKHQGIKINNLNWEITPLKTRENIELKKNADILLSDDSAFNPEKIIKNNKHQIKIALIENDIDKWIEKNYFTKYDIILTKENYLTQIIKNNEKNNVFLINDESIFKQIKDLIINIKEKNICEFNKLIKNFDFEEVYPNAKEYLSILNSEYFDEEWYKTQYEISEDHLDPINHYFKLGYKKGYNPGPNFKNNDYYICNPDVKNANMNPLVHYELFGKDEKRQLNCSKEEYKSYQKFLHLTNPKNFSKTKKQFKIKENQIFMFSPWSDDKNGKLNENSQMIYDLIKDKYEIKKYTYRKKPHIGDYLTLLKYLLESKVIIIDQGFGLLTEVEKRPEQKIINIWHACGAFKKIGYDAPIYTDNQLKKFGREFSQYSNFIVSSPKIEGIYANAHGLDQEAVLGLGVPRTDMFFDEKDKQKQLDEFFKEYPWLKNKEIILYAPTFRDSYKLDTKIDWDKLSEKLDSNEIFIIKRHVMTTEDILNGKEYENIRYIEDTSIFTLMYASKLMITDYSSVIFEYSLLNKPVIHYCPDYIEYISMRDFYLDFNSELYGSIIEDAEDLIKVLSNKDYDLNSKKLEAFKEKYMSACDGHSTERVVKLINKYMED